MKEKLQSSDLDGLKTRVLDYIKSAKVGTNRASGCKKGSLVVEVILALAKEFEPQYEYGNGLELYQEKLIEKKAKNKGFREKFAGNL